MLAAMPARPFLSGPNYRFYCQSARATPQCADGSAALTVTSPPYWNAIDYDAHARKGRAVWYRSRKYNDCGDTYEAWLANIAGVFQEVQRATLAGGFCAIVVGTILHQGRHFPAPMMLTQRLLEQGWEFHQDIVWNKVTGGVKRAGAFIQHPKAGYYYPNIMTEYILVFRKAGPLRRGRAQALPIDALFKRDIANNIWHIAPIPPHQIAHPCPYPEELVRRLVLLYSQPGDLVLDPFLGSGQSARVALRHGRTCVGYDIVPAYLRLAQSRLGAPDTRRFQLLPKMEKAAAG